MDFQIRRLNNREELNDVVAMQEIVWTNDVIPLHRLLSDIHNGGIILGAYQNEQLLGFQYSTPAILNGRSFLWSQMTAVLPEIKGRGLGYKLSLQQREEALRDNFNLVAWTVDPLESLNAFLNIGKLGAICSTYIEDYYGNLDDALNSGMPTDRLKVEWHIGSSGLTIQNSDPVKIDIPSDIQQLKKDDKAAAMRWRLKVRAELQTAFAAGYAICGFLNNGKSAPVHQYLLRKRNELKVANAPWN